jgi:hypothetical protein
MRAVATIEMEVGAESAPGGTVIDDPSDDVTVPPEGPIVVPDPDPEHAEARPPAPATMIIPASVRLRFMGLLLCFGAMAARSPTNDLTFRKGVITDAGVLSLCPRRGHLGNPGQA